MKWKTLIGSFIASIYLSESYKILGIFPLPGKSHFVMFEALLKGLAKKGHEVDVVSHFPLKTPMPRYNDLSIRGTMPMYVNNVSIPFIRDQLKSRMDVINYIIEIAGLATCETILNTDVLKQLKNSKSNYDLVITEIFGCDCMLGFGHLFNAPVVSVTSSVNFPWGSDRLGTPDNPSYIPSYFVPFLSHMSLLERVENSLLLLFTKFRYFRSVDRANIIARNYFGNDLPDLGELAYKTSLMLVNSHYSVNQARPTVPNFIEVAGLHIPPLQPLPKHLAKVMNVSSGYKGVIYFSMGSMVLTETLPIHILNAFLDAFRELPYKVLWKASREKMPPQLDIPQNIHFEPWMPQSDILCHPNTKLFISHGGLMGTQEALLCGVPRIGIPLFADQELNLKTSEALGLVIIIHYNDITKHTILTSAKKVLEDANYRKNAKMIAERFNDRPLSALDTAIYWVEYVIRHKGAPHLRSVGADLSWYQYYLLDVAFILICTFFACIIVMYYLIASVLRILFKLDSSKSKID